MNKTRISWLRRRRSFRATSQAAMRLIPATGEVEMLVEAVGRHRGRVIRVVPCELPTDEPSGVWLPAPELDYLFYPRGVAPEHRRMIICHELSHMLLRHVPRSGLIDTSLIAPSIDPAVAARFFTRHGYGDEPETEAEALATQLATELMRRDAASRALQSRDNVSERLR